MSKDKHLNKCLFQMEAVVFVVLQNPKDACPFLLAWWLFQAAMHFIVFIFITLI